MASYNGISSILAMISVNICKRQIGHILKDPI